MPDPRTTRAWRKLRDQVTQEEPLCWLHFPNICTQISTTADHIISYKERPDLALARTNLHGACEPCNRARGHTPTDMLDTTPPPALQFFRGRGIRISAPLNSRMDLSPPLYLCPFSTIYTEGAT